VLREEPSGVLDVGQLWHAHSVTDSSTRRPAQSLVSRG
jgi:hypothetical protein